MSGLVNIILEGSLKMWFISSRFKQYSVLVFAVAHCIDPSLGSGERCVYLRNTYPSLSQKWSLFLLENVYPS